MSLRMRWILLKNPTNCKLCYWGRLSAAGALGIVIGQFPYPYIPLTALLLAGAATAIIKWSHNE